MTFSDHPLDPGQHYQFKSLDIGLQVETETMWKEKWMHNVIFARDNLKLQAVNKVYSVHQYEYECVLSLIPKYSENSVFALTA